MHVPYSKHLHCSKGDTKTNCKIVFYGLHIHNACCQLKYKRIEKRCRQCHRNDIEAWKCKQSPNCHYDHTSSSYKCFTIIVNLHALLYVSEFKKLPPRQSKLSRNLSSTLHSNSKENVSASSLSTFCNLSLFFIFSH